MEELAYDIVVAGGGTAGSAAAVAASRRGHRVLLIEELNCLGGVSSAGGVGEWFASLDGLGNIFESLKKEIRGFQPRESGARFFNPEYMKMAWQQLADQTGLDILFHASVCGVIQDTGSIRGVRISCCSQVFDIQAKYFIDATGEGDLAAIAGAAFMQGDPDSHRVLHMSLTASLYDTGKQQHPYLPEGLDPIVRESELPGLGAGVLGYDGRVYMNATKVMEKDPTDPFALSEAEREARRQLVRVVHYLQTTKFPTYAIASSGSTIGIREGRRIVGDYTLTKDEVLDRTKPLDFEDGIAVATSQIDFHSLTKAGSSGWRQRLEPYAIPYRCLIPRGLDNVLVAGKCISTDQVVQSSCRMTPTCCAMGQAAGTAAALAVECELSNVRQIAISELREILASDDMELDPQKHVAFAPQDTRLVEK